MMRFVTLAVVASLAAVAARADERADAWREDLAHLARELPQRHLNLFFKTTADEFAELVAGLERDIPNLDDATILLRMMQIVASAGDGHTHLAPDTGVFHTVPLGFYWFQDGIHVIAADAQYDEALGCRVVAVGGVPIETLAKEMAKTLAHDNASGLKQQLPRYLSFVEVLALAGAKTQDRRVTFTLERDGKPRDLACQAVPAADINSRQIKRIDRPLPMCEQKSQLDFWNDWLADSKTVYFKYNRCQNLLAFGKLVQGTAGFIQQNQVERFVLDLRHNGGGNSAIFLPLYSYLKNHPQLDQRGRLYVIIGRRTYSSAVLNALEMKNTQAIFAGEPSGGKPNHYGEVRTFELPRSKLVVSYSTKFFRRITDSDPESLEPDIAVEPTFSQWRAGRDPVLEAVLAHRPDQASSKQQNGREATPLSPRLCGGANPQVLSPPALRGRELE